MSAPSPVLVVGATGQQGSAVVRALQALPSPPQIRALSRNPDSPAAQKLKDQGVDVVRGDLTDSASLDAALAGAGSAFLGARVFSWLQSCSRAHVIVLRAVTTLPATGAPTEDEQGKTFIDAAKRASLPFLVYTSVSDASTANVPHFETKAKVEQALKDRGLKHAVVAPVAFYDSASLCSTAAPCAHRSLPSDPRRLPQDERLWPHDGAWRV